MSFSYVTKKDWSLPCASAYGSASLFCFMELESLRLKAN